MEEFTNEDESYLAKLFSDPTYAAESAESAESQNDPLQSLQSAQTLSSGVNTYSSFSTQTAFNAPSLFSLMNQSLSNSNHLNQSQNQSLSTQLGTISHSLRITQAIDDLKINSNKQRQVLNYHDDVLQAVSQSIVATNKNIRDNNDLLSSKINQLADITICSFTALAQQQQTMLQTQSSLKNDIDVLKKEIDSLKNAQNSQNSQNSQVTIAPVSMSTQMIQPSQSAQSLTGKSAFNLTDHLPMAMLLASLSRDSLCCCGYFKGFLPIFSEDGSCEDMSSLFLIHVPSFLLSLRISLSVGDNVIFAKWLNSQCWTMKDNSPFRQLFWDHFNQKLIKPSNDLWELVRNFLPELNLDDFCWLPVSSLHKLWLTGCNCSLPWPSFVTIQESMFRLSNTKQSFAQEINVVDFDSNVEWFEFCLNHSFIPIRQVFCGAKRQETKQLLFKLAKVLEVENDPVFLVCGSKIVTEKIKWANTSNPVRAIYPCVLGTSLIEVITKTGERSVVLDSDRLDLAIKKFFLSDDSDKKPTKKQPQSKRARKPRALPPCDS
jgi:hypothetical protein